MIEVMEINVEPNLFLNEDDTDSDGIQGIDPLNLNVKDTPIKKQKSRQKPSTKKRDCMCLWLNEVGEQCGKVFSRVYHLNRHQKTHDKVRLFKCDKCPKEFSDLDYLNRHQNTHDKLKLHVCDECSKEFSRRDHLKKHILIHSGIKPYSCEICEKTFGRSDHLNKHLLTHSSGIRLPSKKERENKKKSSSR